MTTDPRLLVLHALRLSGFAAPDRIARATGLDEPAVTAVLQRAATDGHATERTGRISGWVLTADGRAEHAALLDIELRERGARADVEAADRAFVELNEPFKELCSRWQLRPDGSINDHTDPAHDAAVVADLGPLHERVVALTDRLAGALPRFGRYPRAFTAARDRLAAGDPRAFAAPLSESYHDVWMELHQDLLSTLGRERSTADGH
jgi:hypothetical protein